MQAPSRQQTLLESATPHYRDLDRAYGSCVTPAGQQCSAARLNQQRDSGLSDISSVFRSVRLTRSPDLGRSIGLYRLDWCFKRGLLFNDARHFVEKIRN